MISGFGQPALFPGHCALAASDVATKTRQPKRILIVVFMMGSLLDNNGCGGMIAAMPQNHRPQAAR
jgi:hypothetical protein